MNHIDIHKDLYNTIPHSAYFRDTRIFVYRKWEAPWLKVVENHFCIFLRFVHGTALLLPSIGLPIGKYIHVSQPGFRSLLSTRSGGEIASLWTKRQIHRVDILCGCTYYIYIYMLKKTEEWWRITSNDMYNGIMLPLLSAQNWPRGSKGKKNIQVIRAIQPSNLELKSFQWCRENFGWQP